MPDVTQAPGADWWRLQAWLGIPASAKPKIYEQVSGATEIHSVSYWLEIFLSAGIAAFGLVESSPAVIIGAMLISPLMGPIMATGLALAVGDLYLGFKAVLNLLVSVTVSIAFSGFLVWLLPFHSATSEIISRTNPNLLDLGIALFSGLAGSIVVCRGGGEGVTALPGVAIAVALMPPLCVMGFGLGSGVNLEIMGGAGLLFLTNLVAIVASAFVVFLLVGMGAPEAQKAIATFRKDELPKGRLFQRPVARVLTAGSHLRWRVLMILILLAALAVPLRKALLQVASETLARGAVQDELKRLMPANAILSQQVDVGQEEIVIRLISTRSLPQSKVAAAEQDLKRRTGREVQLSVDAVASKSDLVALIQHLTHLAPIIPKEKTIAETQEELVDRVDAAITEIWPAEAPIVDFEVVTGKAGIAVNLRYKAAKDLNNAQIDLVLQGLRAKLGIQDLTLKPDRVRTPSAIRKRKGP